METQIFVYHNGLLINRDEVESNNYLELFLLLTDLLRQRSVRSVGARDQLSPARGCAGIGNSRQVRSVVRDGRGLHSLQSNGGLCMRKIILSMEAPRDKNVTKVFSIDLPRGKVGSAGE